MKHKRGDVREDGKIYWSLKRGKEYWISKELYDKKRLRTKEQKDKIKSLLVRRRCGEMREDGMIFWSYNSFSKNGEYWVSPQKHKELLIVKNKRMKMARRKNPKPFIESCKKWRAKNKNRASEYQKSYSRKNRLKINSNHKKRMASDGLYKLRVDSSVAINKAISRGGFKKQTKTANILGCSFEEFKFHIESQFQPGMSWENRSEWHIDHIMPVSMAKTYDEVVRLNHYKNLRPMWAHENLRKADKTPDTLVLF